METLGVASPPTYRHCGDVGNVWGVTDSASPLRFARAHATWARSWELLRAFPDEQRNPTRFYGLLAEDTAQLIADLWRGVDGSALSGKTVLDVGGGPGFFAGAFSQRGAHYVSCEPDAAELSTVDPALAQATGRQVVRGSGMDLPFLDDSFDIVYSSNVAEHVADPARLGEEMLRVCRPGGLVVLSYTVWFGPFGGHEMGLTHYLGGDRARRLYERRHGHPPKNYYGRSLFKVLCRDGMRWAQAQTGADVVGFFPRYHPGWAWWMVRVPILREVLVSNLVMVLRKNSAAT